MPKNRFPSQCYRVSAEQQISASVLAEGQTDGPDLEVIKEAAVNIFDQYLAEKVNRLDSTTNKNA